MTVFWVMVAVAAVPAFVLFLVTGLSHTGAGVVEAVASRGREVDARLLGSGVVRLLGAWLLWGLPGREARRTEAAAAWVDADGDGIVEDWTGIDGDWLDEVGEAWVHGVGAKALVIMVVVGVAVWAIDADRQGAVQW